MKLAISASDVPKLARVPLLKSTSRGRAATSHVYSVYYDTSDFALRDQRVALRLRKVGSRWLQTLKTAGRVEAGLHQREEIEVPVPAQILNYPALAQSGAAAVLADPALPLRLQPVFVTDFRRTTRQLDPTAGTQIELCLDRGMISAGTSRLPISEIELELKSGPAERLLDFALALLERVPLRLESASKAQRGYALAAGLTAAPAKATAPALLPEMTVTQAFRTVVFACIAHLQANEKGLLETDEPEYLHQARVALRRLRSALSVFNRAFPRALFEEVIAELRWLGGCLGPARDWDVFATETLPVVCAAFPGEAGLHWLTERSAELRTAADSAAREAVAAPRYTVLLLKLTGLFLREPWLQLDDSASAALRALPLPEFAASVLLRRHKNALKRGRDLEDLDSAGLHALRIQVKKLRYAAEFFSALYNKGGMREYLSGLADLQDVLGRLNDAATVERLLEPLRGCDGAEQWLEAPGLVRGWAAGSSRARLEQLSHAWRHFRDCETFWH
ncbi:MAG TPA: CHAD domain-containing protein [Burkholderiales bacterium]|nr:CHAD domain-containing protein [Burkholderiales bacterium]